MHLTKLFVGNLTFKLTTDFQGEQIRIYSDPLTFPDALSVRHVFENRGDAAKAIAEIDYYLTKDKYVLLRTITPRVPFFRRYNKHYEPKDSDYFRPGHVILLIWQDRDHIYYVDSPSDLHADHFVPHPDNHEVGMIAKQDLTDALHRLTKLSTIDADKESLNAFIAHSHASHVKAVMKDSIVKYRSSRVEQTEHGYSYTNKEAFLFLASLSQSQVRPLLLNEEFKSIEQNKILIGLNLVLKRREILRDYLAQDLPLASKYEVLEGLERSIDAIASTRMFMLHHMLKGYWAFDSAYTELLFHIVRAEDRLYDALERYFE
ncbi:hypothetical protein [Paenibacillus sp. HB172176]|uniref:hypothetical protein n=1 Tax=Paenibacillus sp. HB172176 TaxID=2493690 RepID=UPI0014392DDB|nr:hypothetical protein [Paenibacillus sp. HB172176]